jgi:hypothetical protein
MAEYNRLALQRSLRSQMTTLQQGLEAKAICIEPVEDLSCQFTLTCRNRTVNTCSRYCSTQVSNIMPEHGGSCTVFSVYTVSGCTGRLSKTEQG